MSKPRIYTIGHSTHPIEEFLELLNNYQVKFLVDVRTLAGSNHNPQFNSETLKVSLLEDGIQYSHISKLGGLRKTNKESINTGWRNASFRGYADYMATSEFAQGLEELIDVAEKSQTVIMCAEAVPWRCHRSMIGDALVKRGWLVNDIMSTKKATPHRLTPFLKMRKGLIVYPPENEQPKHFHIDYYNHGSSMTGMDHPDGR